MTLSENLPKVIDIYGITDIIFEVNNNENLKDLFDIVDKLESVEGLYHIRVVNQRRTCCGFYRYKSLLKSARQIIIYNSFFGENPVSIHLQLLYNFSGARFFTLPLLEDLVIAELEKFGRPIEDYRKYSPYTNERYLHILNEWLKKTDAMFYKALNLAPESPETSPELETETETQTESDG